MTLNPLITLLRAFALRRAIRTHAWQNCLLAAAEILSENQFRAKSVTCVTEQGDRSEEPALVPLCQTLSTQFSDHAYSNTPRMPVNVVFGEEEEIDERPKLTLNERFEMLKPETNRRFKTKILAIKPNPRKAALELQQKHERQKLIEKKRQQSLAKQQAQRQGRGRGRGRGRGQRGGRQGNQGNFPAQRGGGRGRGWVRSTRGGKGGRGRGIQTQGRGRGRGKAAGRGRGNAAGRGRGNAAGRGKAKGKRGGKASGNAGGKGNTVTKKKPEEKKKSKQDLDAELDSFMKRDPVKSRLDEELEAYTSNRDKN
ncbi:hypothetical protein AAMO2058_000320200 [Amorphochlora amoebiformis]